MSNFMASVAGSIAQKMLGGGGGGGGGGGAPQIQMPKTLAIRGGRMRPTGRRGSQASRSVAAKVAPPPYMEAEHPDTTPSLKPCYANKLR